MKTAALLILPLLATAHALSLPRQVGEKNRLIQFEAGEPAVWLSDAEVLEARIGRKTFFDLTYFPEQLETSSIETRAEGVNQTYPVPGHKESIVRPLLDNLSIDFENKTLYDFVAFGQRGWKNSRGRDAALWVADLVKSWSYGEVTIYDHTTKDSSWIQPSIIVRVPHKGDPNAPTVIIGSHTDSVTGVGADDNGSGVVGILDALRVLKDAVYETTTNPLEFHFYSAEEQGLLGSNAIASEWKRQGRQVRGMVMADMTAYFRGKEVIAVIRDFVNPALTDFIVGQIGVYSRLAAANDKCGYACSDHGSWHKNGFAAAHIWEAVGSNSNQRIHSVNDKPEITGWSWPHALEFSKIWLAFAIELTSE